MYMQYAYEQIKISALKRRWYDNTCATTIYYMITFSLLRQFSVVFGARATGRHIPFRMYSNLNLFDVKPYA